MKKGFTLAEVLITLAIIGIVAALTIPSVISNYQQQEFKTGLKKAVSVLNEAIQTNIAQDGETPYENADLFNYLQRHMSVLKSQFSTREYNWNSVFYTTDGMRFETTPNYFSRGPETSFKLYESGIDIYKWNEDGSRRGFGGNCGSYGLSVNLYNTKNTPCIVLVDVNGNRKPNPYATEYYSNGDVVSYNYVYPSPSDKKITDVFNILITDEKAIPFGVVAQRAMYSSK